MKTFLKKDSTQQSNEKQIIQTHPDQRDLPAG